ncbi:hypothetical protein B1A99_25840 [Cohnella sp. CIP 111063]|uniref:efflux RND transporter periplasmic adaptor subunit n=1 Tax=unclassified Cohnella TaxID=2636738 RepID=UPI000B8BB5AF|nr:MULTISPECIES: efflux RND transporter periplasmic adaptor subunit [unclassified Cohnella]OXS54750.1 hypothetical protein B1A99_25840 [Cohnella sp. CIP 111063]PRX64587.1 RND family efflux transporter MFP subunit [Cohnella sp. SGD-V74]
MELQGTDLSDGIRKRKLRWIAGLFFGILLLLTFFSNTLLSVTLPKVTTEQPVPGELNRIIEGSGVLKPLEETELAHELGWRVKKVEVKQGDTVEKGQVLITYETKTVERQLADEQAALKIQRIRLEALFDAFKAAGRNQDSTLMDNAKRDLETLRLEIGIQERKIQALQEDMELHSRIVAPFAGIVTKLGATEGLSSSPGASVVSIANRSKGFMLSLTLPADRAELLSTQEKLEVVVKDREVRVLEGEVVGIQDAEQSETESMESPPISKIVQIQVRDEVLKGGEKASIRVKKTLVGKDHLMISNAAVHNDRGGKFVYVIDEKKGPLGNAFHVRKSYILIADANENEAAVQEGLYPMDTIVVGSSEPLQEGDRVRLK